MNASLAGRLDERGAQKPAEALPLHLVDHRDGGLGRLRRVSQPSVASHAERPGVVFCYRLGDDCQTIPVVRLGELTQHPIGELRHRREEAPVTRLRREPAKPGRELAAIRGAQQSQAHLRTVR